VLQKADFFDIISVTKNLEFSRWIQEEKMKNPRKKQKSESSLFVHTFAAFLD